MARSTVLVCAGLAVAAAAWLVLSSRGADPALPIDAPAAAPPAPDPAPTSSFAVPAEASASERAHAEAEAAPDMPPIPDDAPLLDVLVVDGKTGQPVAGAEAVWGDETQWQSVATLPPAERDATYRDPEPYYAQHGWHGRSDREGKLRIHLGKTQTQVFARAGTRFGRAYFGRDKPAPPEGHRVLLVEDLTVRVHVLDAAGRAAARVPVSLDNVEEVGKPLRNHGNGIETDAEGFTTFAHVQSSQTWNWGKQRGEPVQQWAARVVVPGLDVEPVLVDAQAPPVEPIEIRLPPTGRLEVKFTFEGKPVPGLDSISFHAGPRDNAEASNGAWSTRCDDDGWARFGYVPLGKTLIVSSGAVVGNWDFDVVGPTAPEQKVTAALELANEVVVLVGRLLESDGAPVASQPVMANFDMGVMSGGAQTFTDEQGRFAWAVFRPRPDNQREAKIKRLAFERRPAGAPPQRISVPPRDLVVGRNDLGDLRFTVDSLVVGGSFVFDTPGSQRTWFQVERQREARGRNGPTVRWETVEALQIDVKEDGAFEVRGTVEPGRYRLRVQGNDHLPVDPVEFAVGAADLRIDVRRGVPFEVACRLPARIGTRHLVLRMQPDAPAEPPKVVGDSEWFWMSRDSLLGQCWGDGGETVTYRWPALAAGTYTLLVQSPGLTEPLLAVADVVAPQPEGGDSRLRPLDLRETIGTLRVNVTAPERERRNETYLFFQPQLDDALWQGIQLSAGETLLPAPKGPVDVLVAGDGLRPVTVRGARDRIDAVLEPWPSVDVHFVGLEGLPADVVVRASAREPTNGRPSTNRYRTEHRGGGRDGLLAPQASSVTIKDGVASLSVGDGVMNLSLYLSIGERGRGKSLKQVAPNQIVAGAPVTVQLSADEIRTAIEALRAPEPAKK
ncbi:MAG TPA: hypothetical protein VFZ65_09465 [Planctomycetota bacterium]|nr:hypothetical protein [Planctomycetota bacterium]